jgi:uncharacterized membrane protein YgdD (TMEM256/DUF423 family)
MNFATVSAGLLGIAVALGAFGAHALKARLDAYQMGIWEKAVFYHFIHALGMLILAIASRTGAIPDPSRVLWLLLAGIVFFSGSLYALALSGVTILGAVTPIGGVCMILGWTLLAYLLAIQTQR